MPGRRWGDSALHADVIVVRDLAVVQHARDSYVRLERPLLVALLFGKRIATPSYCSSAAPVAGTSICFLPALKQQFGIFFTASFRTKHDETLKLFRQAVRKLGDQCKVVELDTEANAKALAPARGMVVDGLTDFSALVRKFVSVAREPSDRGTYRRSLLEA